MNEVRNITIIGSGPAGLTAAIYTARANLNPLVLGGISFGGQLMGTTDVENYPGFPEGIQGPVLMQNMVQQAERFGADIKFELATKVDFTGKIKSVWTEKNEYLSKAVIIASGSSPKTLNIPGEWEFWGKGVSTCATCDGAFYKDKVVAVIGGGDSALEESLFLTKFAKKVYVIHRRDKLRASKIMQDRAMENSKIEFVWDSEVKEVVGDEKVKAIRVFNKKENTVTEVNVDGVFLAIGHIPNTQYLTNSVKLDKEGFVKVYDKTNTSVEGIFVAGDIHDHLYQQAITAAGMGCMAAMDAEKYLELKDA